MFKLPDHVPRRYGDVGFCIYCGAAETLSDEHIIPLGLGGRWVLPQSSCKKCAGTTSAFEGVCQRAMLGLMRMYFEMPTRRPKERPEQLALRVKKAPDAEWSTIDVSREVFPFLILMPLLHKPAALAGEESMAGLAAKTDSFWIRGASFERGIIPHLEALAAELRVAAIEPQGTARVPEFVRMLAKIAHGFAIAELGLDRFEPSLLSIVRDNDTSQSLRHVGGLRTAEPATGALHEVSFFEAEGKTDLVCVRIRLFASLEMPTYFVVAGKRVASTKNGTSA